MIIESAYQALEVDKKNTIDQNCHWLYLALKIDNNIYRMVFELNKAYCEYLLRQWSVNNNTLSSVPHKYFDGQNVSFDCSNGLIGTREFEFSIEYEFCLKPMGIPLSDIRDKKYDWALCPSELKTILEKNNIAFEVVCEGVY